jgi:hypothetical protein
MSDGAANGSFGDAVSISGNTVVVGTDGATVGGNSGQGAAYVFGTPAIPPVVTGVSSTKPTGTSINATTGLVTWTPNVFQAGSNTVTVLATDQLGNAGQQTFSVGVSGNFASCGPFAPGGV